MTDENKTVFEYAQPYEVYTSTSVEVDSKGNRKPTVKVAVTRKLTDDSEIENIIKEQIEMSKQYIEGVLPDLQE